MTIKTITTQLDRISEDSWCDVNGNRIDLTINDFEGFDSDWSEIYREFIDEDTVGEVLDWLEKKTLITLMVIYITTITSATSWSRLAILPSTFKKNADLITSQFVL